MSAMDTMACLSPSYRYLPTVFRSLSNRSTPLHPRENSSLPSPIHRCKPNQVSVIPLLLPALWQHHACNVELGAAERLSSLACGDALDAGDQGFGRGAQALDLDFASRFVLERPISGDAGRLLGVGADADLAFEPLRRAEFPEKHE